MAQFDSPLNNIKIASPCSADWEGMFGNERKRFCGDCKLNVYNLSGMTRTEAESLLEQAEGGLCVRYYRRADGTILTQDCPVGWAKVKQRASMIATAAFSLIVSF
ncbi:MAG TPA: PASTA domain-containing protein, partial [Pyrinomonadaceae bacterium]|nr:PASTA domain-containing protein [Pyrinomonadaceae bacterium]